jgi:hypothetical protein
VRVLFVFLDGVGIGPPDADANPFVRVDPPPLAHTFGGAVPTLDAPRVERDGRAATFPLDATLGMPGLPQSGTGQAALLTGLDAPALFGRHFGPWVPVGLRRLVEERSFLRQAVEAGRTVIFANAYPRGWPGSRRGRWIAGMPLAARGAGLLVRHDDALERGEAVASEIVNDGWRSRLGLTHLPSPTPEEAGRTLARLAGEHELTVFAHYSTDYAGHRGDMEVALKAVGRVDRFLAGVLEALPDDTLLLVASDHGNLEDVRVGHTRNPSLGMLVGPGATGRSHALRSIADVATSVGDWLAE